MNTTPFDLFNQDTDDVIMLINYYINLGAETENTPPASVVNERDESAAFWAAL